MGGREGGRMEGRMEGKKKYYCILYGDINLT